MEERFVCCIVCGEKIFQKRNRKSISKRLVCNANCRASLNKSRNLESFSEKYTISPSGCWEWQCYIDPLGYSRIYLNGKQYRGHRYTWELYNGEIPEGMNVLHKCDNRKCINPDHLFLGTQKDNVRDMISKNRQKVIHGEIHPKTKLTNKDVIEIFLSDKKSVFWAKKFGLTESAISSIRTGKSWSKVTRGLERGHILKRTEITDELRDKIIKDNGSYMALAKKYGVSNSTVWYIKNDKL